MKLPPLLHTGVPRRLLLGGLLGSTLTAVGGVGVGAVPRARDPIAALLGLQSLHRSYTGRWVALAMVLVGVLLLTVLWWRVGRLLQRLAPGAVLAIAGLWSLPLIAAPPLFSRDVYAYAGQGHLVASGVDPYTYGPGVLFDKFGGAVDTVWAFTPAPYGPVWLWLTGRVVALTGNHVVASVLMLRLVAVGGLVLIAWGLPYLARAHGVPAQRALWLGLANPLVLLHGVGGAHNDTVMVGLLVCGLAVAGPSTGRLVAAAALVTVAALVKLPAAAALAYLPIVVPGGWRVRARSAGLVAASAALTALVLTSASGLGWGWLRTVDAGSARLSVWSPLTGVGVLAGHALDGLGIIETPGLVLRLVLLGGLLAAGLTAVVLLSRASRLGPLRALGLTLVTVVALAPVVQPWYLLWGLVLLAAVGGERIPLALAALSVTLCLAVLPNGRSVIQPPLYGLPALAAVALAAVGVRASSRGLRPGVRQTAPL